MEDYDHSHCYASCDPKTEKQKYYHITHKSCDYYGSNELFPDSVQYRGNLVETDKLWSIYSICGLFNAWYLQWALGTEFNTRAILSYFS